MMIWHDVGLLEAEGHYHPEVDYFPTTPCPEVFSFSFTREIVHF